MFSRNNNIKQGTYSIKDAPAQLVTFVGILLVAIALIIQLVWGIFGIGTLTIGKVLLEVFAIVVFIVIFSMFYHRYKAIRKGYELDVTNHTLSFPGGGNAADDITNFGDSNYLLQYFKRKTIDLDTISEIRRSGNGIEFVGTFGATSVAFSNAAKRDELYNAIRLLKGMGTPVFAATGPGHIPNTTNAGGTVPGKSPTPPSAGNPSPSRSLFGKKP